MLSVLFEKDGVISVAQSRGQVAQLEVLAQALLCTKLGESLCLLLRLPRVEDGISL